MSVALPISGTASGRGRMQDMEACKRRQLAEHWAGFAKDIAGQFVFPRARRSRA